MYTEDHIFMVLLIKDLINEYGYPTNIFKLATGKDTAHVGIKALNMRQQEQKVFCGIFVEISHHQKGYPVCIPHKHKIASSYNVVYGEIFSIALAYTSQ